MQAQSKSPTINRRTFCQAAGLALATIPTAAPAIAAMQDATPAALPGPEGITGMLALAPASLPGVDNLAQLTISYADIATQLDVTGAARPTSMDDERMSQWTATTRHLAMPANAMQYLMFWREDYGFDLLQADETLWLSQPPFDLSLYRGQFDHEAVRRTLTANGYREVEVDGYPLLSLRDDFEVDVSAPFAYKLAAMNHVALLDDGTIACSSTGAALVAVLDVIAGQAPAMMEQAGIAMLAEQAPADLVSAMIIDGTALAGLDPASLIDLESGATPDISAIATEVAQTGEMPPVVTALLGATGGGSLFSEEIEPPDGVPDARAIALALMLTPASAEAAEPVVEERLATGASLNSGVPFSEYFPDHDVRAVPSMPVLVVDLTLGPETPPHILFSMLGARDLGFLAW